MRAPPRLAVLGPRAGLRGAPAGETACMLVSARSGAAARSRPRRARGALGGGFGPAPAGPVISNTSAVPSARGDRAGRPTARSSASRCSSSSTTPKMCGAGSIKRVTWPWNERFASADRSSKANNSTAISDDAPRSASRATNARAPSAAVDSHSGDAAGPRRRPSCNHPRSTSCTGRSSAASRGSSARRSSPCGESETPSISAQWPWTPTAKVIGNGRWLAAVKRSTTTSRAPVIVPPARRGPPRRSSAHGDVTICSRAVNDKHTGATDAARSGRTVASTGTGTGMVIVGATPVHDPPRNRRAGRPGAALWLAPTRGRQPGIGGPRKPRGSDALPVVLSWLA